MTAPLFEPVHQSGPFYQAAAFFPMPVVLVATRDEHGETNLAPYSLCFPQPSAGEQVLMLISRGESNTARNLRQTGQASLCFIVDDHRLMEGSLALARRLSTAEKMRESIFTLQEQDDRPVIAEAEQVLVCALRSEERLDSGELRFLLQVDQVLMKPRWRRALERGWGAPKLAVEYGFRGSSPRWMSRPRAIFGGPALRPRFEILANMGVQDAAESLARALADPESGVEGIAGRASAQVNIPDDEADYWSPELQIQIDEVDGRARLRGRIGPHPHVWMLFMGLHLLVAFAGLAGLMFGLAQLVMGVSPWALWAVPAAVLLSAFVAGAAFIGQGLGTAHVYRLRAFVDQALDR